MAAARLPPSFVASVFSQSMGHRLTPTERAPRSLRDLVNLLRAEFPFVEADKDKGSDHIGDMIAQFLKIKAGYARWKNPPPQAAEVDAMIQRFNNLRENAAFVTVADDEFDEDRCVSFNLVPGEDVIIAYANQRHQEVASALTERIADALGYCAAVL